MTKSPLSTEIDMSDPHRGMSYGFLAKSGFYATKQAKEDVAEMAANGVKWVALMATVIQETFTSTRMYKDFEYTVSDCELAEIIEEFHRHDIKVMLKPMLECLDAVWRGHISFPIGNEQIQGRKTDYWTPWFDSFEQSILAYAQLAQDTGCEMFCLGCEIKHAEQQVHAPHWERIIKNTRSIYKGPVTYDAVWPTILSQTPPNWMKDLDAVCVSYYRPVADGPGASLESIIERMEETIPPFREASEKLGGIPIIFGETGCRSVTGAGKDPARYQTLGDYAPEEQSNFIKALASAFSKEPWWLGMYWWKWDEQQARPHYQVGDNDIGFTLKGKPSLATMKELYSKPLRDEVTV